MSEQNNYIGKITHYFSNIGVAVIGIEKGKLKQGDKIQIIGGDVDFEQVADSMQVDHISVEIAKKGDDVGLKTTQKVHEGYKVFKID